MHVKNIAKVFSLGKCTNQKVKDGCFRQISPYVSIAEPFEI